MPHDFDASIVNEVEHRPWPMPTAPWVMTQTWQHLLFAHWPIEADVLRPKVPMDFELDLFNGQAWIGVVPFYMTNVAPRGLPALPRVSEFPELNVRTYVRVGDKPGVYFFSLDAASTLAVRAARLLLNLPYYVARMEVGAQAADVEYRSSRARTSAEFHATYGPTGTPFNPVSGTLEYFLTERYCLYHRTRRGSPYRLEIHHPPWSLQTATARILINSMDTASGLRIEGLPATLHFVRRQDMVAWMPTPL